MPLDRLIDKEPRQFAYFHRLMGYSILSLILVIYTFTSTSASYQLYILPLLLVYFLFCPKLEKWLQYKYDKVIEKNVVFACEAIIVAIVLAPPPDNMSMDEALDLYQAEVSQYS